MVTNALPYALITSVLDSDVVSSISYWTLASQLLPDSMFHTRMRGNLMSVAAEVSVMTYLRSYLEGS
jgi:hypothetical protein